MTENYWGEQDQQPTQQQVQQVQPYQQAYQQPQYQQPMQTFIQPPQEASSLGSWVLTLLLAAIPIVGLVMLLVWSFGSTPDESKKNWARANLIWTLIAIVIYVILFLVMGVSFPSLHISGSLG